MTPLYVKANNIFYTTDKDAGINSPSSEYCHTIKKLKGGKFLVEYFDRELHDRLTGEWVLRWGDLDPNCRIILYPNSIQEVKYVINPPSSKQPG